MNALAASASSADTHLDQPMSTRAAVLALLDALADESLGYAHTTIFESSTRGALDALYAWAKAHGHRVIVSRHTEFTVHSVTLASGTWIEVQA